MSASQNSDSSETAPPENLAKNRRRRWKYRVWLAMVGMVLIFGCLFAQNLVLIRFAGEDQKTPEVFAWHIGVSYALIIVGMAAVAIYDQRWLNTLSRPTRRETRRKERREEREKQREQRKLTWKEGFILGTQSVIMMSYIFCGVFFWTFLPDLVWLVEQTKGVKRPEALLTQTLVALIVALSVLISTFLWIVNSGNAKAEEEKKNDDEEPIGLS